MSTAQWHMVGKTQPQFETDENDVSEDVLVYGVVTDLYQLIAPRHCFGIGYIDHAGVWYVATAHGTFQGVYPNGSNDSFTVIMWRYLDDPPSVKDNAQNTTLPPHQDAIKQLDRVTSPYTPRDIAIDPMSLARSDAEKRVSPTWQWLTGEE